jgi:L-cysteate sulfo-lyase
MHMTGHLEALDAYPRAKLVTAQTPLDPLARLSDHLGLDLWIKRDDLTGLGMGGNKIRQLEYYIGAALAEQADTILITGAVQSNFVRSAAAAAARSGMKSVLQLEERVPGMGGDYYTSGNVFLSRLLGADHIHYPKGEDEVGADANLHDHAKRLRDQGRRPFVIPLGLDNKPLGALGYVNAAGEILDQGPEFDAIVVASGSGATHSGLLAGLRAYGSDVPVFGICVRRDAGQQKARMITLMGKIAGMLPGTDRVDDSEVLVWDGALSPGYGQVGPQTVAAMSMMAQFEGLFLDPVYTAKTFAGVLGLLSEGKIKPGARVLFVHTGGQPALFAYQPEIEANLPSNG